MSGNFDRRVLAQESNSIRLTAVFGFVTILFALLLSMLFNFSNRPRTLIYFSLGHFLLAPMGAAISVLSGTAAKLTVPFYAVQLAFDLIELALRIFPLTASQLLELRTIGELLFIFINAGLVIIDIVYLVFIYRYFTSYDAALAAAIIGPGGADEMDFITPPEYQTKEQHDALTEESTGKARYETSSHLDAHRIDRSTRARQPQLVRQRPIWVGTRHKE